MSTPCNECGSQCKPVTGRYVYHDKTVGEIVLPDAKYLKCIHCGDVMLTMQTAKKLSDMRKQLINDFMNDQPISEFITTREAAEFLGITRQALHKNRRIDRGFVYSKTIGDVKLFHKRSLDIFKETGDGRFPLAKSTPNRKLTKRNIKSKYASMSPR
jgi:hypothetical protein